MIKNDDYYLYKDINVNPYKYNKTKYNLDKLGDYELSDEMEYALYLYISYCHKLGIDSSEVVSFIIENNIDNSNYLFNANKDFKNWVLQGILAQDQYADYLKKLGINLDSDDVIELYCGKLDVANPDKEVISPYAITLGQDNSILYKSNGTLFKITKNGIKKLDNGKTYIIKNPYSVVELLYLLQTIGGTDNKVILSFFGDKYDNDVLKVKPMMNDINNLLINNPKKGIIKKFEGEDKTYIYSYIIDAKTITKTVNHSILMSKKELNFLDCEKKLNRGKI